MAPDGPALVIAGAGSGKTRALTYRVARLIDEGVNPENILLATFTNKAAKSMLTRVEALIGSKASGVWGGTFHHLGNRILRKHSGLLGYSRSYSILDRDDARQLLASCIADLGIGTGKDRFPKPALVGDVIGLAENTRNSLEYIVTKRYQNLFKYITDIHKIALRFRIRKKELNVMDFDDLLVNWLQLLREHEDIREKYAGQFVHVLVDEYQDTNVVQAEILNHLAVLHNNIMVVGDDSQSIYSFRGADFTNIFSFPAKYKNARIFKLETNYRSTPPILHFANMSIENNEKQFQKKLKAVREGGARPIYAPMRDITQQANFVVQRIIELFDAGVPLDEIAVLYRAHYHSMELQMELVRRRVPFVVRSGIRFFEQAHIKDITAVVRILVNPFDELAWKRVLTLFDKIGKARAEKIWKFLESSGVPHNALFSSDLLENAGKSAEPGIIKMREIFKRVFEDAKDDTPWKVIESFLAAGYRDLLTVRYDESASREDDLRQLVIFSRQFQSLADFLSDLALMTNIDEENNDFRHEVPEQKVVLSTIHQAKGLEWSVVFMIRCSEGMIPLARALREPGGVDEERRLFYVATTRAKDQLYLCHTIMDGNHGYSGKPCAPSRFIEELAAPSLNPHEQPFEQWLIDEI
ncbi:MAG: ATP-dependent helicase [Syntrophales bacterium]|nr:ATP-dependent helicase [Syntrophales bacterium]